MNAVEHLIPASESYAKCAADAVVLNALHWKELYGPAGYRANHGAISDLELAGGFSYFTLRNQVNRLAGHAGFTLTNSPFYGQVIALDSFYFVLPEFRGKFGMTRLLRFAANHLLTNGADRVLVSHKTSANLRSIIERAGFACSGEIYSFNGRT